MLQHLASEIDCACNMVHLLVLQKLVKLLLLVLVLLLIKSLDPIVGSLGLS